MTTGNKKSVLALAVIFACSFSVHAASHRLKMEGMWDGNEFSVKKIKIRDAFKDPKRIRVSGVVSSVNIVSREITIGPIVIRWNASQDTLLSTIKVGQGVEADAESVENPVYFLVRLEIKNIGHPQALEIIGAISRVRKDGTSNQISIAGITARVPIRLYSNGRVLLRRLDDKRPESQLVFHKGQTRLTLGGELGLKSKVKSDYDLNKKTKDDNLKFAKQFQLELFAEFGEKVSAFLELKFENETKYELPLKKSDNQTQLNIGEAWVYLDQPGGLPVSLQIGRQNFADQREWWWDDDLDAIRLYYSNEQFRVQIALAEPIIPEKIDLGRIDAEDEDISRVLATFDTRISSALSLQLRYLHHHDHSGTESIGTSVNQNREDDEDSDLDWFGVRAFGKLAADDKREISYWLDWAYLTGSETVLDFEELLPQQSVVIERKERKRSGWAIDVGFSYVVQSLYQPTFTFGYAIGSGKRDTNGTFRETGLNDNNNKFNGVDRFRYYGELSRPELSNLGITTLSFGLRPWRDSSVELIHHQYRQQVGSPNHTLKIRQEANGLSRHLGQEIDFVLGIEKWEHVELEISTGYFWAGRAFNNTGRALLLDFKFNYNF